MHSRQIRVQSSITSCVVCLQIPELQLPTVVPLRLQLEEEAAEITRLYHEQFRADGATGVDGGQIAALRRETKKRLARISSLAVVALRGMPGIKEDVRLPPARISTPLLIEAAERIVKNVRPHLKTLYEKGLERDTIAQLQAATKALAAKYKNPETEIAKRARATRSLPVAISNARETVNAITRAIQEALPPKDLARIRWEDAARVKGRIGRPKKRKPPKPES